MISDHGLGALRVAATLAHTLPGLALRVEAGGRHLLAVGRSGDDGSGGPRCTPCGFRTAVGRAHRRHRAGERLAFLDLPEGTEPDLLADLPEGGAVRPGGLHRVPSSGRWLWAFATTVPVDVAREVGAPVAAAAPPLAAGDLVGLRWDELTEVTVAYAETSARPGTAAEAAVVDLLEQLLAACTAHELVLAATADAAHRAL